MLSWGRGRSRESTDRRDDSAQRQAVSSLPDLQDLDVMSYVPTSSTSSLLAWMPTSSLRDAHASARGGKALLEVADCALQRARNRAADEPPVNYSAHPRARVEVNREPVVETAPSVREAAFVARIGQSSLDACVLHDAIGIERAQRHLELDAAAQ